LTFAARVRASRAGGVVTNPIPDSGHLPRVALESRRTVSLSWARATRAHRRKKIRRPAMMNPFHTQGMIPTRTAGFVGILTSRLG